MKNSYRKILLLALTVIMLCSLTLFTACGKNNAKTTPAKTSSPKASAYPTVSPTQTTAGTTDTPATSAPSGTTAAASPSASNPPVSNSNADYKIVYGSATIDGKLDEAAWKNAQVVKVDQLKIGEENAGTDVSARVMWDEKGLYFAFEITDSNISAPNEAGHYNNDSIYIYIDEEQVGSSSFDTFADGVYQFALIPENGKEKIPRYGEALPAGSYNYKFTRNGNKVVMEFFYKPTHAALKAGTEMLLDFQYNDATNGTRDGALAWYNATDDNARSELWGTAELIAKGVAVK